MVQICKVYLTISLVYLTFGLFITQVIHKIMNIFVHSTFSTVQLFFLRKNSKSVSFGSKTHNLCFRLLDIC